MHKNLLLVLGAYKGDAIDAFFDANKVDSSWDIVCYEPNNNAVEYLRKKYSQAKIYTQAVWNDCKKLPYFLNDNEPNNSLITTINTEHCIVETENIVNILDNISTYNYTILRIDIEGAEYIIIPEIIKHTNLKKINELYIEWHIDKFPGVDIEEYNKALIRAIPNVSCCYNEKGCQHTIQTTHSC